MTPLNDEEAVEFIKQYGAVLLTSLVKDRKCFMCSYMIYKDLLDFHPNIIARETMLHIEKVNTKAQIKEKTLCCVS